MQYHRWMNLSSRALQTMRFRSVIAALTFALLPGARAQKAPAHAVPQTVEYGGHHEFGGLVGYSPFSGPVWGYSRDVRYSPTILRYSFLVRDGRHVQLRYAPELTALAILRETKASQVNPNAPSTNFAAGFSPEGFQVVFRPRQRVQPFLSNAAGVLYFDDRVLSPQGSQFMFTIDFGAGVNLFTSPRNTVTLGYRYTHLSNANISEHNPGTDADTFYVGFSHFFTKGRR